MARIIFLAVWLLAGWFALLAPAGLAQGAERQLAILLLEHAESSPWTEMLRAGLASGAGKYGLESEVLVAGPEANLEEVFEDAASRAQLVIVASDNFHEILRNRAANHRRVKFGVIDAGLRAANIMSITFADEQASFLAGLAAAMLTQAKGVAGINSQKTIGWLSGRDTPAMRSLFNGFAEGAKLADPETRIIQGLAETFTDESLAAEKIDRLLDSGADIIALAAGAANPGALRRVSERGAHYVALDAPMKGSSPLGVIAKAADRAVAEIMGAFAGEFRGKEILTYDLANGGTGFQIPQASLREFGASGKDAARRVEEVKRELENRAVRVPSLRERALCDCQD